MEDLAKDKFLKKNLLLGSDKRMLQDQSQNSNTSKIQKLTTNQ